MTTAYITHADCLRHEAGPGHPECPDRLASVNRHMQGSGLLEQLRCLEAPLAQAADLERVHAPDYVELIFDSAPATGHLQLDPDTAMNAYSLDAARRAAGAGLAAVDEVTSGRAANAFCAVRPCGHHATRVRSMGFCIFNNIAVAAAYAIAAKGIDRVAIVDFDVHHGNGSQAVAEQDADLFYASTHQWPLYPGTGAAHETGLGNVVNVPLGAGTQGVTFRQHFSDRIMPALTDFAPDLLLISAGFDAHAADPLGGLRLVEADFAWVTDILTQFAKKQCSGRIVSVLEGGYDLGALGASAAAHVEVLMAA